MTTPLPTPPALHLALAIAIPPCLAAWVAVVLLVRAVVLWVAG